MSQPADPKDQKKEEKTTTSTPAELSSTGMTPTDADPWPSTAPPPPKN